MAALAGRKVILKKGSTPVTVAAGRSKSITIGVTPIDVSSEDDGAARALLTSEAGEETVDISFEGVLKDDTFLSDLDAGTYADDYTVTITGIGDITGEFFITNLTMNGPYREAATFSFELQSTGSWSYTAAV